MRDQYSVLISGYAKLPSSTTAETVYSQLVVAVIFDRRSGVILEAEASLVTQLAKRFVSELLVGYNLNDGPEALLRFFAEHYHGSFKKALETAIKAVFTRYQEYLDGQKG